MHWSKKTCNSIESEKDNEQGGQGLKVRAVIG